MLAAGIAETVGNMRQLIDNGLLFRQLRIQHAQRIRLDAPLAIGAQLVAHFLQFAAQPLHICRPAILISDGIDVELCARQIHTSKKCQQHLDHFRIERRMVGRPQQLRANLIELPVPPFLWPFAPEHRPDVVKLYIPRPRVHAVLDVRAHH